MRGHLDALARAQLLSASGEGKRIRERYELSLRYVGATVGVAVSTVWRWENGDRRPRGGPAAAWANLLDHAVETMPLPGPTLDERVAELERQVAKLLEER